MFCPHCGNNLPDGSQFCTGCGNPLSPSVPAQPAPPQPTPRFIARNKKEWLATQASPTAKKNAKLSLILTAVTTLVLIAALCIAYFGPFYNIPIFQLVLGDNTVEEFKDLQDKALDADEQLDDFLDSLDISLHDALNDDELEELYNASVELIENPSLNNMRRVFTLANEQEVLAAYDLILSFLWIAFAIVAVFAVLGGLLKSRGLVIAGIVCSIPVFLLFSGVILLIVFAAVMIVQVCMLSQVSTEYKAYKTLNRYAPTTY